MSLSEFKELISGLAVVTTVLNFLAGMLVCKQYVVNRSTAEASPLPFLTGVLASALWLMYGITKNDNKIILVNTIGITLMTLYSLVFYMYTYKKSTTFKQMVVTMCLLVTSVGYLRFEEDKKILLGRLGTVACLVTLLAIAAPMSKLFYVLKVKSTECLPFPMILMSFFVSSLWFLYGVIEEDNYLIIGILTTSTTFTSVSQVNEPSTSTVSDNSEIGISTIPTTSTSVSLSNEPSKSITSDKLEVVDILTKKLELSKTTTTTTLSSLDNKPSERYARDKSIASQSKTELPNLVGAGLSVFQLSLFIIFPRTPYTPLLPKSVVA